jgi:glycogen debranching enzyme
MEIVTIRCEASQSQPAKAAAPQIFNLSTFEFNDTFAPEGYTHLKRFRRDTGAHFDYEFGPLKLTKSVYLLREYDTVAVVYDFSDVEALPETTAVEFVLRPFIALRDFHSLQKSSTMLRCDRLDGRVHIGHETTGNCQLLLDCDSMTFDQDPQWWFNFIYRTDRERGQEFAEDLWSPGFFKCEPDSSARIILWASLAAGRAAGASRQASTADSLHDLCSQYNIEKVLDDLNRHYEEIEHRAASVSSDIKRTLLSDFGRQSQGLIKNGFSDRLQNENPAPAEKYKLLCLAADQFVTNRQANTNSTQAGRTTILAGFPWFADWGRDTFISLPGLLLLTGRTEQAKSVLMTFAEAADEGMIPNRFDDYSDTAYFNSIDASLWFINAAFQYLAATKDNSTFAQHLLPTIRWIIDSYQKGTRFGIHADNDGLITGGSRDTQLTWMDAKFEGTAFTPRYGKAVEVNALWYNSLCHLARYYGGKNTENANHYLSMAEKTAANFTRLFWNDKPGYLNDCITPDGTIDTSLRPNQIFAVSLAFSPLSPEQASQVVAVVQQHLLTPYGLRTLPKTDAKYEGNYTGPQSRRDRAYHQGTVWPYLMGHFVEAYLKVNGFSRKSKKHAAKLIQPLLEHLAGDRCIGQISEIFDGDPPHKAKGCFAQAWSVAELIRAYNMIYG